MKKPIIRSITVFTPKIDDWSRGFVKHAIEESEELLFKTVDLLKNNGYEVWTIRLSLPQPPPSVYIHIDSLIGDTLPKDLLVSLGGFLVKYIDMKTLTKLLEKGFYIPLIPRSLDDYKTYVKIIYEVSRISPLYCTQIGLSLVGTLIETPYFPLSTSINGLGIGVSLLYPNMLREAYSKRGLRGIRKTIQAIEYEIMNTLTEIKARVGIDFSLSPWMEESVANLITAITGALPNEPGFIHGISLLNNILDNIARGKPHAIGFNEVMLPLAEDNGLKEAGLEGKLRARDFLLFSSTCLVGPDMIVVPWSENSLTRFVLDAKSIAETKKRTMGLRVIPIEDASPGEKISLGRFGEVPVIPY